MSISFRKISTKTRLMNPLKEFCSEEIPLEIRFDPLTGQTGRIFDLPYSPPGLPDVTEIIQRSKEIFCPFCPEVVEKSTPLFPKEVIAEGRIRVGDALLVPNLLPLDKYTGISIVSSEHFIAMADLTPERMRDAFSAARLFIKRIADLDPQVNFFYINWNYMPEAGSSLVHPHIQVNCGAVPTNYHRSQMEGCRKYYKENRSNFWQDFIRAERELGERFIGELDSTFWTMSYVPQSYVPDVWCIFPEHDSITRLTEDDFMPFLRGLSRTLAYFSMENISSFNMSMFSVREDENFCVNVKICPRHLLRGIGNSDQTYFQILHKEPCAVRPPESVCETVKKVFGF